MVLVLPAQVALLQELCRGPGWADGLRERLRRRTAEALQLSHAGALRALAALAEEGLVEEAGTQPRGGLDAMAGGRPRRLYKVTEAGLAEAERQRVVAEAVFSPVNTMHDSPSLDVQLAQEGKAV